MSISKIGKRIKSPVDEVQRIGFPKSDKVQTLPAGKPSEKITSYIVNDGQGWYQVSDQKYIRESNRLQFVDDSAEDESGFLSGAIFAVSDWLSNTGRNAEKKAGFLKEGFNDSISDVGTGFSAINNAIKPILILVVIIVGIGLFRDLTGLIKK